MTDGPTLEDIVADYLDERDDDPALTPADYAARFPDRRDRVLQAIESTLQVLHAVNDAAPPEQKRIGTFRIVREIGRGGMGIVYEAERSGRPYAIKLIPFAPISGPRAMERFRREIQILERLDHRNIVKIVDSGLEDGAPFIAMEFIDGEPMSHLAGVESPRRVADLVRTVAVAVQVAHDKGILHRDIKPQNIMMRRTGAPVLLDFGLMEADDLPGLTSTGDMVGTPRYMPPERIRGEPADARTDVYGLGMVLYELLVGQPAYDQISREMIIQAVTEGRFPRPRRLAPDLDRGLEKVILKALATEARHRYATAAELADDLGRFLENRPVQGKPPGRLDHLLDFARRQPRRAAVSCLVVVLVAASGTVLVRALHSPQTISTERAAEADMLADRAAALWFDDRDAEAVTTADRAIEINPANRTAHALVAIVRDLDPEDVGADDTARALAKAVRLQFKKVTQDDADDLLETILEVDPLNTFAMALRGRIARRQGRVDDAEKYLRQVESALDDCAEVHECLGWVYDKRGRYDEAITHCERAIDIRPDSGPAWTLLAKLHARRGTLDEGLVVVQRAKAEAGRRQFLQVMNIEAAMLDESGRRKEAQEIFRKILELSPDSGQVWFNLGLSLDSDHQTIEAAKAYETSIENGDAERVRALLSLAHIYCGASSGSCGDCDDFYASHPEYLDSERAFEYWKRAVVADAGKQAQAYETMLGMSFRFPRGEVLEFLEEVAAREPDSPRSRRLERIIRKTRVRRE